MNRLYFENIKSSVFSVYVLSQVLPRMKLDILYFEKLFTNFSSCNSFLLRYNVMFISTAQRHYKS